MNIVGVDPPEEANGNVADTEVTIVEGNEFQVGGAAPALAKY